jgi:hypothetical protein
VNDNDTLPEHLNELARRINDIVFDYAEEHGDIVLPIPALVTILTKLILLGPPGIGNFVLVLLRDQLADYQIH